MLILLFALGILVGMALATLAIVFGIRKEQQITQTIEKLGKVIEPHREVEFIAPADEEAEAIGIVIDENTKRGRDTKLDEL